jgi:hypothetical protein
MKSSKSPLFVIAVSLLSLGLWSCSDFTDEYYSVVPPEVTPQVNEFFKIASEKGLKLDRSTLKIYYTTFKDFRAGNADIDNQVIKLDTTSSMWTINRESLLFHELGHVYLHRGHDDKKVNGYVGSIMNTYLYSYGAEERQYYIDELFMPHK